MKLYPRSYSSVSDSESLCRLAWRIGTLDALNRRMNGGVMPGGSTRSTVWETAVTWETAASMLVPGWKNTLMTAMPFSDWDSMCSIPATVVVMARSSIVTMRRSMSSGPRPLYCQMEVTTGMSISGKMSVAMRRSDSTPNTTTRMAPTMNVYGRLRPSCTSHMMRSPRRHRPAPLPARAAALKALGDVTRVRLVRFLLAAGGDEASGVGAS